jgi:mannose-6-phosphate isomerase-like protein (cupin superfamily)
MHDASATRQGGKVPVPTVSERALTEVRRWLLEVFRVPGGAAEHFCRLVAEPAKAIVHRAHVTLPKPYGANHILAVEADYGISFACIDPGHGTSVHYHVRRRETFLVRTGTLLLLHGDTETRLHEGDIGQSIPGTPHSLRNGGASQLHVLEMFLPALLDDKVRVADRYARPLGAVDRHQ